MTGSSCELHGVRIFLCSTEGPPLLSDRDAVDLMSAASEHRPKLIVIPVERLNDDFFNLRTRIAGQILQKFVTYGARVAILGDISHRTAESDSLSALVKECNRGNSIWFAENMDELADRLATFTSGPES